MNNDCKLISFYHSILKDSHCEVDQNLGSAYQHAFGKAYQHAFGKADRVQEGGLITRSMMLLCMSSKLVSKSSVSEPLLLLAVSYVFLFFLSMHLSSFSIDKGVL